MRHLDDLVARRYEGAASWVDRVAVFQRAVELLDPVVRGVFAEADAAFLENTGEITRRSVEDSDGSVRFRVGMTFDDIEREMLLKTLAYYNNNKRSAARALGITTKTIYNRLLRYRSQGLIDDSQLGTPEDSESE